MYNNIQVYKLNSQKGLALIILTFFVTVGVIVYLLLTSSVYAFTEVSLVGLKVSGNQIVNSENQIVKLYGINRSGAEFACIQGTGIFDGPSDAPSIDAMKTWNINAVRIPLNEDCWLGINGVMPEYGGENYKQAILDYVNLLISKNLAVILELHWSAPGTQPATGQQPMPDRDHTPAFWIGVADTFKGNSSVLFDLFNEPYPDNNQDTTAAWICWRDGGTCPGMSFQAAGMQELVDVVRSTGATNIIMLGGVQYSNRLSKWLEYKPTDPTGNLVASWHIYNFNPCNNQSCWDAQIAPVAAQVPVLASEIGENTCSHDFIDPLMVWLDSKGIGYLGWTWNTWNCRNGPSLISNYDGTPTAYGIGLKEHIANLINPVPTDTIPPTVFITSPENGAIVKTNSLVNINVSASDNVNVSKVEFYVNSSLKCTSALTPYTCLWRVTGKKNVTYTISAKAYDSSNNSNSASVTVKSQ